MVQPANKRLVTEAAASGTYVAGIAPAPTGGDDLAALTAALAANNPVRLRPGATYLLSAQLTIPAGKTLYANSDATIQPLNQAAPPTYLVTMSPGAAVRGVKFANSTAYGIHVAGVSDCRIVENTFSQLTGYAVLIEGPCARTSILGNTITNTTTATGQGITVKGNAGNPTDTVIQGNRVSVLGTVGIEAQTGAQRTSIVNNAVSNVQIGITVSGAVDFTIAGNASFGCSLYGIEVAGCTGGSVAGNTADTNGVTTAVGIILDGNPGSTNVTITGNTVIAGPGQGIRGVWPAASRVTVAITGNTVTTTGKGIYLTFAKGVAITGNSVDGGGAVSTGVELEGCTDIIIASNQFDRCVNAGVNLYGGAMTNIIIGPNVLTATPADLVNGPLGAGGRIIRGTLAPIGSAVTQPAIPLSGTAVTNATARDCTVFVNGGTVTAVAIGGTATGQVAGGFRVPAGQTITLTYSVAPTWTWFGE